MYEIPRFRVQLVRESTYAAPIHVICSSYDAFSLLYELLHDADREYFLAVMVDNRHQVIGINTVSVGTINASLVHPREVFKPAILVNAAAILLAHNHPSGDPSPSEKDLVLTACMKQAGELLGIGILDHLILGEGTFVSLKDRGLL